MKTILLFLFLFLINPFSYGQGSLEGNKIKISKINILFPGYEFEQQIFDKSTIGFLADFKLWGYYNRNYQSNPFVHVSKKVYSLDIVPTIELFYKWYFNLDRRIFKQKNTSNFSASYLSTGIIGNFSSINLIKKDYLIDQGFFYGPFIGCGMRRSSNNGKIIYNLFIKGQFELRKEKIIITPGVTIARKI